MGGPEMFGILFSGSVRPALTAEKRKSANLIFLQEAFLLWINGIQ